MGHFAPGVAGVAAGGLQADGLDRIDGGLFDRLVGEQLPRQTVEIGIAGAGDFDAGADAHLRQRDPEIGGALDDRCFDRIHDAGLALHLDHPAALGIRTLDERALGDRVAQQPFRHRARRRLIEFAADEVVPAPAQVGQVAQPDQRGVMRQMRVGGGAWGTTSMRKMAVMAGGDGSGPSATASGTPIELHGRACAGCAGAQPAWERLAIRSGATHGARHGGRHGHQALAATLPHRHRQRRRPSTMSCSR